MLFTAIIEELRKPSYWPDQTPGEPGERDYTYVVEGGLSNQEKELMKVACESAARRSVKMISKMDIIRWSEQA